MAPILFKQRPGTTNSSGGCTVPLWLVLISNVLVFFSIYGNKALDDISLLSGDLVEQSDMLTSTSILETEDYGYALVVPQGTTPNLPSVRIKEDVVKRKKNDVTYGGKGDKAHLGGFTEIDLAGISPAVWKRMVTEFGIRTLIDLGCGRGISTSWFLTHGVDAMCVEGSHDAVLQTMLPDPSTQLVEHDFSRGPWWPADTKDAVWCVEFLEHVGRNFHHNYLPVFRKSALIFATHSIWGGWHHVEVHPQDWWITKMQMYGFRLASNLTLEVRATAKKEQKERIPSMVENKTYNAQHVWSHMLVFINPAVAALPQHAHLMAEPGCFNARTRGGKRSTHKKCGTGRGGDTETPLPPEFEPIVLKKFMDSDWDTLVTKNLKA